jgi:hypothetical protein
MAVGAEGGMNRQGISRKRPARQRVADDPAAEGEGRILADIPMRYYRRVKVSCAERGISMKAFVLELLDGAGYGDQPVRGSERTNGR